MHTDGLGLDKASVRILQNTNVGQYVADGVWKHDPTAKTEPDHEGNTNNVIHQSDLTSSSLAGAAISSVGPGAT